MTFPTPAQNAEILTALAPLAAVRKVIYMPHWSIAELEVGDGRVYKPGSLPGIVGGRTMLYHHSEEPFFEGMKEMVSCLRLKGADSGSWFEVEGGEVALLAWAEVYAKSRPVLGDGEVGVGKWERRSLFRVFGDVSEEIRGSPIVRCETGEAVGEFGVVDGVVECVAWGWDELGGEGWVVV